ncbi:MAG: MazG nucleotide pyrophosphohydrolase domain-containing protein [Gammaproteobacteria bacterium]
MKNLRQSVLDGVPSNLPALIRAVKLQQRAAGVGFDWAELPPVLAKIREELAELEMEITARAPAERTLDELGDVLFAVANLARKLELDPEQALHGTNRKFQRRFGAVEQQLAKQGKRPQDTTLKEMDVIWEQAKHDES